MELRQYVAILWRWAWLIVLGTLLAGVTAFLVSRNTTPMYQASTTLLVSEAREGTIIDYTSLMTSERLARTYSELLKKRPVLDEVIRNLDLAVEPDSLATRVDVQLVRDTQLIVLSVEDADPRQAAAIANKIPQIFITRNEAIQTQRYAASKESLLEQMANIEEDIQRAEKDIARLRAADGDNEEELARLEDNLSRYRATYASLLTSYEDIRVTEAKRTSNILVVEPAEVPGSPVSPRTLMNTLLAAIVGAMLAVGVVFLIEYLDDTMKTDEDVERELALPTLGNIAKIESIRDPTDNLVTLKYGRSAIGEAYRVMRSNVQFAWVDNPSSTLLVTSPGAEEGKTTIVANLAVVMAQAGQKVVLVDADLRRPALHKFFDMKNDVGLTDLLVGEGHELTAALKPVSEDGLRVLTAGKIPPNPAALLGSDSMRNLIDALRAEADVVLFDSPPVLAVADTGVLASLVGGALMVLDSGRTRSEGSRRAKEALDNSGVRLIGVVLNCLSRRGSYGYYHYYYYSEDEGRQKRSRRS